MKLLSLEIPGYGKLAAPTGIPSGDSGSIDKLAQYGLNILFIVAAVFAIFTLLLAGIQWITSDGDKQKVVASRLRITYAIIGLVVVLLAFLIVNIIGGIFDVKLFTGGKP